jgi:hypothetical protein
MGMEVCLIDSLTASLVQLAAAETASDAGLQSGRSTIFDECKAFANSV